MLISLGDAPIHAYQSVWGKNEIDLSQNDHFFGDGLSDSSFLFPPNQTVYLFGLTVLCVEWIWEPFHVGLGPQPIHPYTSFVAQLISKNSVNSQILGQQVWCLWHDGGSICPSTAYDWC